MAKNYGSPMGTETPGAARPQRNKAGAARDLGSNIRLYEKSAAKVPKPPSASKKKVAGMSMKLNNRTSMGLRERQIKDSGG